MQTPYAISPAAVGNTVRHASRQMWLAGLGAAVVTREWAEKEAGRTFGKLVREGTAVESRALRMVGTSVEASVSRASGLVGRARVTLRDTVTEYAAPAISRVRQWLPSIELPSMLRPAVPTRSTRATSAKRAGSVKRARVVKRAKTAKRAAKR